VVFHNNINAKTLKGIEEIVTAVAIVHNLVRIGRGGNTNDSTEPAINYIYITEFADPVTNAYDEGMGELGS
jgi:hypothetical protein